MALTRFVRQYTDQSTDSGFQFEFFCDRCGAGYQTDFVATHTNTLNDMLDAAGSLFGGVVGAMASLGQKARSAAWEHEHDRAFQAAVQSLQTVFQQCVECGQSVDTACWAASHQCCKECLANHATEDHPISRTASQKTSIDSKDCTHCQAKLAANAKFCTGCGRAQAICKTCPACGLTGQGKFCADCGANFND